MVARTHVKQVNVHQAKTHFSRLLHRIERGGEVIIARANRPVAKLIPFKSPKERKRIAGAEFKNIVGIVNLGGDAVKDADDYFS